MCIFISPFLLSTYYLLISLTVYVQQQLDSAGHEDGGLSSEDEDDADSHTHHTGHAQSIAQGGGSTSRAGTTGGTVGTGGSAGHHSNPTSASPAQMALAAAQYSRRAGGQVSGQEFIIQLATTRKMLHNILEKHDAVPDKVSDLLGVPLLAAF